MWNLEKNDTDELICWAEIEIERTDVWILGGDGMNREIGIDIYALLCIK